MNSFESFIDNHLDNLFEYFSEDINTSQQKFIKPIIKKFNTMVVDSMLKNSSYNTDQIHTTIVHVSESTLRKSIILANSNIPLDLWEAILKPVAGGVFEIILNLIENNFHKTEFPSYVKAQSEEYFKNSLYYFHKNGKLTDNQIETLINIPLNTIEPYQTQDESTALTDKPSSKDCYDYMLEKIDSLKRSFSEDVEDMHKQIIIDTLKNLASYLCKYSEELTLLETQQIEELCNSSLEWTFRKSIILAYSDIPSSLWDEILFKVGKFIFDSSKSLFIKNNNTELIRKSIVEYAKYYFKDVVYSYHESGMITNKQLDSLQNI